MVEGTRRAVGTREAVKVGVRLKKRGKRAGSANPMGDQHM